MFSPTVSALLALSAVAMLLHRIGMWATWRYLQRPRPEPAPGELPGLTLLKPVKGLEEELEANLRSFFEQDYPGPLQLVFASTEIDDPALALARRVARDYPEREACFVVSSPDFGLNPKVSNMRGGLLMARHDLVLQSDANVRIAPGYLRGLVSEYLATGAGLLGSLVVGSTERAPGAVLENLQLTAFTAPGLCMAKELANITCVLGKAMLFRRSELEALGGLARVKDVLAEDYVLGQIYERAGHQVALSTRCVENVNVDTPLDRFLSRHARWLKMRAVVSPPGFLADVGSSPTVFSLAAFLAGGLDPRLALVLLASVAYKLHWDVALTARLRGRPLQRRHYWASPVRDLLLAGVWLYAAVSRSTQWRGERFRLTRGSGLVRDDGPLPVRLMRRVLR